MRLKNKVSIITGGGQGIGQATAIKFAKEGAKVVVCDINDAAIKETLTLIQEYGGEAMGFNVDVTDKASIAAMVSAVIAKFGRIDTLVNNAGIVSDAQLKKMDDDQFDRVIETNLKGTYNCTRAVVDVMLEQQSGWILNASSIVGLYGNFGPDQLRGDQVRSDRHGKPGRVNSAAREFAPTRFVLDSSRHRS